MAKSNNLLVFTVTFLILLFGLNQSIAESDELEASELHPLTIVTLKNQLTKTIVDGRIQYVLGARIAGKSVAL